MFIIGFSFIILVQFLECIPVELDPVSPLGILVYIASVSVILFFMVDMKKNVFKDPNQVTRYRYEKFKDQYVCPSCGAGSDDIVVGPRGGLFEPLMARCTKGGSEWIFTEPFPSSKEQTDIESDTHQNTTL